MRSTVPRIMIVGGRRPRKGEILTFMCKYIPFYVPRKTVMKMCEKKNNGENGQNRSLCAKTAGKENRRFTGGDAT